MATPKKVDWGNVSSHRDRQTPQPTPPEPVDGNESADRRAEVVEAHSDTERPTAARTAPQRAASRPRRAARFPMTYRLEEEVLDLIELAVTAAAEAGERLTRQDAVSEALRQTYGHLAE